MRQSTVAEVNLKAALKANALAEKNLEVVVEANVEAHALNRLAESAWHLTILAFIFIPLNSASSTSAMHLTAVAFSVGLVLRRFFAVAVPLELVVLILAVLSGPLWNYLRVD
jgi:hypothetical protein